MCNGVFKNSTKIPFFLFLFLLVLNGQTALKLCPGVHIGLFLWIENRTTPQSVELEPFEVGRGMQFYGSF